MIPRLEAHGICKAFGATRALNGVDISVAPGEVLAVIGENGAGKSTLMNILSGVHLPDSGTLFVDGRPYRGGDPQAARAHGIAIVHQELSLCDHLTVAENICLGAWPSRHGFLARGQLDRKAQAALDRLGADVALASRCGDLSPAQRQLVEIARALAGEPRLLILDEPTSSLGARDIELLFRAIRSLTVNGLSVVLISHQLDECRALASRFTVLRDGASVGAGLLAETSDAALIRLMVGRDLAELYPKAERTPRTKQLALNVTDQVTVDAGEILGIYGLIGAGRSELLHHLFTPPTEKLAGGIGLLSEDRRGEGLLIHRSIADNLTLTCLSRLSRWGWLSTGRQHAAAIPWIQRLGIKCAGPGQIVRELSGGNQQKVALGRLLHHGCRVLLLDEPTRGIDVGAKAQIYRLISEQAAQGTAVVMVSSYLPELFGVCDSLAVMRQGKLSKPRPVDEWTHEQALAAAV